MSHDLKVTLIQSALHWEDIDANLDMFGKTIMPVEIGSTEIIVLPEMFTTGFTMNASKMAEDMNGKAVNWMRKQAEKKKCAVTGSLIIKDGGNYFNRLVWMKPDGTYQCYDKRHLFRMGEENNTYTPGTKRLIVECKGWKICPMICYDLRFPVWSRNVNNAYDILIYVANWPDVRGYPWRQLLIARAIENQSYLVAVNRIGVDGHDMAHSGYSQIIDPRGQIITNIKPGKPAVETVTLSWQEIENFRKTFPVGMDADEFEIH